MKQHKGYTLLEIVVALGIFSVVATLIITAFASVSRVKGQIITSLKGEQEVRFAQEYFVRMARTAEKIDWPTNDQHANPVSGSFSTDQVMFYYNTTSAGISNVYGVRFTFTSSSPHLLGYNECPTANMNPLTITCNSWTNTTTLLGAPGKNFVITSVPNGGEVATNSGKGFKFSTLRP